MHNAPDDLSTPLMSSAELTEVTPRSASAASDSPTEDSSQHINPLKVPPFEPAESQSPKTSSLPKTAPQSLASEDEKQKKLQEDDGGSAGEKSFSKHAEITVGDLVRYITKDVQKTRHSKALPMYLVFLIVFTVLLLLDRSDGESSTLFFRDLGTRLQLYAAPEAYLTSSEDENSRFSNIQSYDDYYGWLDAAVERIWPAGSLNGDMVSGTGMTWTGKATEAADPMRVNIPLGFVLLRQYRVKERLCSFDQQIKAIPLDMRLRMNFSSERCYPSYSSEEVAISNHTYFDNTGNWSSNVFAQKGSFVNSIPRTGVVGAYDSPSQAFTVLLDVSKAFYNTTKDKLTELKAQKWIDEATRAVFVETVTYNQADGGFVFTSLLVEKLATNNYVPSSYSIPFHHLTLWSSTRYAILVLDLFTLAYVLYDFCHYVYTLKSDHILMSSTGFSGIGVWGFFQCVSFGLFLAAYYYRGRLWFESWNIGSDYYTKYRPQILTDYTPNGLASELEWGESLWMWANLAEYAYLFGQWSTLIAGCAIMSWLRLFSFIQYNEKLNILTETINKSVGDLVGVILIGAIVVMGYGISCHVLYGDDLEDFRHLRHSIGILLRTLVSGDLSPVYTKMAELHQWETRALVLSYYLLVWLILLNMILAIITGSFSQVQEGMEGQGGYTLSDILSSIKGWVDRKIVYVKEQVQGKVDLDEEEDDTASGTGSKTSRTSAGRRQAERGDYIQNRIKAVQLLRESEKNGAFRDKRNNDGNNGCFIHEEDFQSMCDEGELSVPVGDIFEGASKEVSASSRSIQQGEMWARGITHNLHQVSDLATTTKKIKDNASKIVNALKSEENMHGKLDSVFEELNDLAETSDRLQKSVTEATDQAAPLPDFHEKLAALRDSMTIAGPNIVQVMEQLHKETMELRPTLLRIERSLHRWTGKLHEDIKRGTLWGPPTAAASTRSIPRMTRKEKGKGVVDTVSSYSFPQHYPQEDDPDTEDEFGVKRVFFGGEEMPTEKPASDPVAAMTKSAPPRSILKRMTKLKQRGAVSVNPDDL